MKDITVEINRLINALNAPALAFNEVATENNFPLIPVIQNLDAEKLDLANKPEHNEIANTLYASLKSAGGIASAYQQALSQQPRDRDLVNAAKLNYETVRDSLVKELEKINA